ncbi:glycoside hydrolase superfamily [Phaeosphaeriaceae sp. PMI808]|nr:glycoside hydrolase superfamily [Phaeosphaeriaceae sp. PMI808]
MRVSLATFFALAASTSARFIMYADEWHPIRPDKPEQRAGVDHVVIAFAMANATVAFQPKIPISTIRSEFPNAKVMIAVGGWGDDIGFLQSSKTDATMQKFATDVTTMLTNTGADGVDIDWEYPGGNGEDYKRVPNSEKAYQIKAYPKVLAAIRASIGKKLLSVAVPGKKGDMIGFTKETGPEIWKSVDYINVMTYDLMNRRDNITRHHTSVAGSVETVENYLAIGAPPQKINLGFAYYAKYFTTQGDCSSKPLGCPIVPAEDPITGKDLLTSGAWTYETFHMKPVDTSSLTPSMDGTCGPEKNTKCTGSCCSQYGNCGNSKEHCAGACQHAFGTGCTDSDVHGSWQKAIKGGQTDNREGGQYYFDAQNKLFWTWDTPALITRKFEQIVRKYKLGGVMAWSLGEDSFDWSHIAQMTKELGKSGGGSEYKDDKAYPVNINIEPQAAPVINTQTTENRPQADKPSLKDDYDTVWVDGTLDGLEGDHATKPGSPEDYVIPFSSRELEASTPQQNKPIEAVKPIAALKQTVPEKQALGKGKDDLPFSPEYEAAVKALGAEQN